MNPTLIVIGGLPGTGKSTLANALSKRMNVPVFSKDDLEAAVARKGLASNKKMLGVGYEIMEALSKRSLENNNSAIFDFIASRSRVEELWPSLLESNFKYIACICSNQEIHKERVCVRERSIPGWYELTWQDILSIQSSYQSLKPESLVLDSVNNLNTNIKLAIETILQ